MRYRTNLFGLLIVGAVGTGCSHNQNSSTFQYSGGHETQMAVSKSAITGPRRVTGVTVGFSTLDEKVFLNQPVLVMLTIKNDLDATIEIDLGPRRKEGFVFTLTFPDGRKQRLPPLPQPELFVSGIVKIDAKERYSQEFILNEWSAFPIAGTYKLNTTLASRIVTADGRILMIPPIPEVTLNVLHQNADSVREMSERLLKRINIADGVDDRVQAALALTFVNDSTAIPYLLRAINSDKGVEHTIMNSLAEQGGDLATEVLINVAKQRPPSKFRVLAKSSLKWIAHHTSEPGIRQRIQKFLSN